MKDNHNSDFRFFLLLKIHHNFLLFLFTEIFCTDIQTFENGDVTYSVVISSFSGVPINSTVSFSCDAGFRLSLDLNITCLATGSWSEVPPVCSGEFTRCSHQS